MADNAAQKMIYGHYTMYSKTIVLHPEMLILGHNAYCDGYISGGGVLAWDPLNDDHESEFKDGILNRDLFVTLLPMNYTRGERAALAWRSFTGQMPSSLNVAEEVNRAVFYPGCHAVAAHWGMSAEAGQYGPNKTYRALVDDYSERQTNVICMQAFQLKWDANKGDYLSVVLDKGHWGDRVYAGMRQVIDGQAHTFEIPFYHDLKTMRLA